MRVVAEGLRFPEGPVALNDRLLVCEVQGGTLASVDLKSGAVERILTCKGGPNGAAVGPDGALFICNNGGSQWRDVKGLAVMGHPAADYPGGSIQKARLNTGALGTLYAQCGDHGLKGPNDIVFDATGGFWFTDMGKSSSRSQD